MAIVDLLIFSQSKFYRLLRYSVLFWLCCKFNLCKQQMSVIREESADKNVGIISMEDFLHFLKVSRMDHSKYLRSATSNFSEIDTHSCS